MNYNEIQSLGNKVAKTICSRDWRGFSAGFSYSNGVIEEV